MLNRRENRLSWLCCFILLALALSALAGCSDDTTESPKPDGRTSIDKGATVDKGPSVDHPRQDLKAAEDVEAKDGPPIYEDAGKTDGPQIIEDVGMTDGPAADLSAQDGPPVDQPTQDTLATDLEVIIDCTVLIDGTNCSPSGELGFICLGGECKASVCGDLFVDASLNEECDDGNDDPADGCSACHWICKDNTNCDDEEACNGSETCNLSTHLCEAGTPLPDATPCTQVTGGAGECNGEVCGPAGCGNGITSGTEECDDGNVVNEDGCDNDCMFSCHVDLDCEDFDACTGTETCVKETGKQYCQGGTALVCEDNKDCTTDTCDPATGCVYTPIDGDGDGMSCEDDCDDKDPWVYVGAPECLDKKDNDCDTLIDDPPTVSDVKCWEDFDKDGYAHLTADTKVMPCGQKCDDGFTSFNPAKADDCGPCVPDAHPKNKEWYSKPFCTTADCKLACKPTSFDYNCSGAETLRWTAISNGCKADTSAEVCVGDGWVFPASPSIPPPPGCGVKHVWRTCIYSVALKTCMVSEQERTQECH